MNLESGGLSSISNDSPDAKGLHRTPSQKITEMRASVSGAIPFLECAVQTVLFYFVIAPEAGHSQRRFMLESLRMRWMCFKNTSVEEQQKESYWLYS